MGLSPDKGEHTVTSIAKIQEEILALSETDYQQLRQWFNELDRDEWDRQIEADSNAGKLDFLTCIYGKIGKYLGTIWHDGR
jgi:hypothetical protein